MSTTNNNQRDERNSRRVTQGVVSSDKMDQSITVVVARMTKHPKYHKYIKRHSKIYAHDEKNEAQIGDTVEVMECRPLSKIKRFRLVRIVEKSELPAGDLS